MLLQLQLHLHSGNRTQHFLLRHSLRYQQLLHNKTLHSDLLLRSIRFPVQDITVRNTEQRNRRSGWKQSLSLLHPLPRLLLFRLLCSLPQQLSLLLLLRLPHSLCLRCQSCILNMEMEAETIFTLASLNNVFSGSICAVHCNRITDQWLVDFEPAQKEMCRTALAAGEKLYKEYLHRKKRKKILRITDL